MVDVPPGHPAAAEWVLAEALAVRGYAEARYDSDGRRWEPVLRPLAPEPDEGDLPLTANDVLVVTGGARGITAECALQLARESGARLALFGLSQPTADDEIVSNLERLKAAGIDFRYYRVDVTDAAATREAVREVEKEMGPVTGILHGAARNVPCLIENLDAEAFSKTLGPKIQGAQNLLAAINPDRLRLFITFGSIIARTGLPGEAHYGLANEWLTRLTERWQTSAHTLPLPRRRVVCMVGHWHGRAPRHGGRVGAQGHHPHPGREGPGRVAQTALPEVRKRRCGGHGSLTRHADA